MFESISSFFKYFDLGTYLPEIIDTFLKGYLPEWAALLIEFVLIGVLLLSAYAVIALILIYVERKVTGFFQCRVGPNRVGKYGIIQSVAMLIIQVKRQTSTHFALRICSGFVSLKLPLCCSMNISHHQHVVIKDGYAKPGIKRRVSVFRFKK